MVTLPKHELIPCALKLKDAILGAYDPEAIILFGSLGRGDADEFSDVDLLVVMETVRDPKQLSSEMSEHLNHITEDKHIIIKNLDEFLRHFDIPGTIVFSAVNEGQALFEKQGLWKTRSSVEPYRERKREVLEKEYAQSAREFLDRAESSLQANNLFRCRDFTRFAAVRAIKGLFVMHDMHPPRETDLIELFAGAKELQPWLTRHEGFLSEVNSYCPKNSGNGEKVKSAAMLKSAFRLVEECVGFYT